MPNLSSARAADTIAVKLNDRSIGKKILMSVSGVALLGYIVVHMLGNLQIFMGQNQLNQYAHFLRSLGPILWTFRAVLLLAVIIHIIYAVKLTYENYTARPIKYKKKSYVEATLSSRTMIWTGIGLFLFVAYHLMHFTFIVTNPYYRDLHDALGRHDTYSMVILGFQNILISVVYMVSLAIVSYHLVHAAQSMFQTWGINDKKFDSFLRKLAIIFAWVIFLGYISIPIAVLTGLLKLPEGVQQWH